MNAKAAMGVLLAAVLPFTSQAEWPDKEREQLQATLWMQKSVEYRGNAQQAYRQARSKLVSFRSGKNSALVDPGVVKPSTATPAVVLDLDETVLDNSAQQALLVASGKRYSPERWNKWVLDRKAPVIPGAKEFILEARRQGFRVAYISNRACNPGGGYDAQGRALDCPQKAATLDNLQEVLGYRPADADVLLRDERVNRDDSTKRARRLEVAAKNRIAMLVGDDLNDFVVRQDYQPEMHDRHWGFDWFILANGMYGSWLDAMGSLDAKYSSLEPWAPADSDSLDKLAGPSTLNLVSWNLEWLADPVELKARNFWRNCKDHGWPKNTKLWPTAPFCDVYQDTQQPAKSIVNAEEYEAKKLAPLREAFKELAQQSVDIIAVQEVQNAAALSAVLPDDYAVACFTLREDPQNIGYVVRKASKLQATCRQIEQISLAGQPDQRPLRNGLELVVNTDQVRVTLLNVHLKSSCPTGALTPQKDACKTFQRQVPPLEAWIEKQGKDKKLFAIIGDWNRDLEAEVKGGFAARSDNSDPSGPLDDPSLVRNVFPEINDGKPAEGAIDLVVLDRTAAANKACHDILDQMVVSETLKARLDPATLSAEKKLPGKFLAPSSGSDHCPIRATLSFAASP